MVPCPPTSNILGQKHVRLAGVLWPHQCKLTQWYIACRWAKDGMPLRSDANKHIPNLNTRLHTNMTSNNQAAAREVRRLFQIVSSAMTATSKQCYRHSSHRASCTMVMERTVWAVAASRGKLKGSLTHPATESSCSMQAIMAAGTTKDGSPTDPIHNPALLAGLSTHQNSMPSSNNHMH